MLDVLIIGGGPAGTACALELHKSQLKVAVLERNQQPSWKPGEIFDSKIRIPLQTLGLWESFLALKPIQATGTISSWGGGFLEKSAMIDPYGGAFFVNRIAFEQMIQDSMNPSCFHPGTNVVSCTRIEDYWHIMAVKNGVPLIFTAKYLVEATGRGNSFAAPGTRTNHDDLVAILGYTNKPSSYMDRRFYLEGTKNGWSYVAPLPEDQMVFACLTDKQYLPKGKKMQGEFYSNELKKLTLNARWTGELPENHFIVSARTSIRNTMTGAAWMAIGESASVYDPLTGFGVVSALNKGIYAGNLLSKYSLDQAGLLYEEYDRSLFDKYLQTRHNIYGAETRWPDEAFWQIRHGFPNKPTQIEL